MFRISSPSDTSGSVRCIFCWSVAPAPCVAGIGPPAARLAPALGSVSMMSDEQPAPDPGVTGAGGDDEPSDSHAAPVPDAAPGSADAAPGGADAAPGGADAAPGGAGAAPRGAGAAPSGAGAAPGGGDAAPRPWRAPRY